MTKPVEAIWIVTSRRKVHMRSCGRTPAFPEAWWPSTARTGDTACLSCLSGNPPDADDEAFVRSRT